MGNWLRGLSSLTVVTSPFDVETVALAAPQINTAVFRTEVFWDGGADFNKGAAMAHAFERAETFPEHPFLQSLADVRGRDHADHWFLFFDADIVPPKDWYQRTVAENPQPGNIYGARRFVRNNNVHFIDSDENGTVMLADAEPAGFFLLFNCCDPNAQVRPIVDTQWTHAGNYDTTFLRRWPREKQFWLEFEVEHLGDPGKNWCGVGREQKMRQMLAERSARGGWQHETIAVH